MKEIINVEGVDLEVEPIKVDDEYKPTNIRPGDTVIGRRNGDWKIGTVSARNWQNTVKNGWMYCDEITFYPFYFGECRKVVGGL